MTVTTERLDVPAARSAREAELWLGWINDRSEHCRRLLVEMFTPIVIDKARKAIDGQPMIDADALISLCLSKIEVAINKFDPFRVTSFSGYLNSYIRNCFLRVRRTQRMWSSRQRSLSDVLGEDGGEFQELIEDPKATSPDEPASSAEAIETVIGVLSRWHRTVIRMAYLEDLDDCEIAERYGFDSHRIRRVRHQALAEIAARFTVTELKTLLSAGHSRCGYSERVS